MNYFSLFVLLKDTPLFFNEFIVEIFEDFLYTHIGSFFD